MEKTINVSSILAKRATAAVWASINPILKSGEFGVETDTLIVKVGDGVSVWNSLPSLGVDKVTANGGDIKDTVVAFTEASTRENILTGEKTSTIFGKIKKWLTDLKPHAFNDLATVQGTETDKAPTNKLLNDTAALKANASNPIFTGKSSINGILQGAYRLYSSITSPNWVKFATVQMSPNGNTTVRFGGNLALRLPTSATETIKVIFELRYENSAFSALMTGYISGSQNANVGTFRYVWDEPNKQVFLYYKPQSAYRNATLTIDEHTFLSVNANDITMATDDTGSTTEPSPITSASSLLYTEYKSILLTDNISTVMPISSAAASNTKVLGEKTAYDNLAPKASPTFTGTVTVPTPVNDTDAATKKYVDDSVVMQPNRTYITFDATVDSNTLHIAAGATDIIVKWGDGNTDSYQTGGNKTHTYTIAKRYEIEISGEFNGLNVDNSIGKEQYISVIFGTNCKEIPSAALYGCSSLLSVKVLSEITSIGNVAFASCSKLIDVALPNSITSIGRSAFAGCANLVSVNIPTGITAIAEFLFADCNSLRSIIIPYEVTSIGDSAFDGCWVMAPIRIPNSVTVIGNYAFYNCFGLVSLVIPDSVTTIGNAAFSRCENLATVIIGSGVADIGDFAFDRCVSLKHIKFGGVALPTIDGSDAFKDCRVSDIEAMTSALADGAATAITNGGGTLLTNYRKLY